MSAAPGPDHVDQLVTKLHERIATLEAQLARYAALGTPESIAFEKEEFGVAVRAHDDLEAQLAERDAQCAAMREGATELTWMAGNWAQAGSRYDHEMYEKAKHAALATDAGKAMLEWKKSALRALGEWHEAREMIGGTQIGDGPKEWARRVAERLEKAEASNLEGATGNVLVRHVREQQRLREECAELKRLGQQFERDSRNFFEQSCRNLERAEKAERERDELLTQRVFGWDKLDTKARAQAIEDCAKVLEALHRCSTHPLSECPGGTSKHLRAHVAAIRALGSGT